MPQLQILETVSTHIQEEYVLFWNESLTTIFLQFPTGLHPKLMDPDVLKSFYSSLFIKAKLWMKLLKTHLTHSILHCF